MKKNNSSGNTPNQEPSAQKPEIKSKSQRKREMTGLQTVGEELVKLPRDQFEKIELPENLYDAIVEARRIQQHGAHKRQLQYIGKLMRNVDATPIREQIDTVTGHSKQAAQTLHHIELWRDKLLTEGDQALAALVKERPHADRQYLRQLQRNAQKETLANKPPRSARALFKYLRELMQESAQESTQEP